MSVTTVASSSTRVFARSVVCGLSRKISLRVLCVSPAAIKRVLVHASLLHFLLVFHVQACIAVQCMLSLAAG